MRKSTTCGGTSSTTGSTRALRTRVGFAGTREEARAAFLGTARWTEAFPFARSDFPTGSRARSRSLLRSRTFPRTADCRRLAGSLGRAFDIARRARRCQVGTSERLAESIAPQASVFIDVHLAATVVSETIRLRSFL